MAQISEEALKSFNKGYLEHSREYAALSRTLTHSPAYGVMEGIFVNVGQVHGMLTSSVVSCDTPLEPGFIKILGEKLDDAKARYNELNPDHVPSALKGCIDEVEAVLAPMIQDA